MDCSDSFSRTKCVLRPGRPPEVGFVGSAPSRSFGSTFISRLTSARMGMPVESKRLYFTSTDVMFTVYMKPTIGGPHWKVTSGSLVESMAPPRAPTMAVMSPRGGAAQASSVSARILVSHPMSSSFMLIVGGWATSGVGREELADMLLLFCVGDLRRTVISLGLKSK